MPTPPTPIDSPAPLQRSSHTPNGLHNLPRQFRTLRLKIVPLITRKDQLEDI